MLLKSGDRCWTTRTPSRCPSGGCRRSARGPRARPPRRRCRRCRTAFVTSRVLGRGPCFGFHPDSRQRKHPPETTERTKTAGAHDAREFRCLLDRGGKAKFWSLAPPPPAWRANMRCRLASPRGVVRLRVLARNDRESKESLKIPMPWHSAVLAAKGGLARARPSARDAAARSPNKRVRARALAVSVAAASRRPSRGGGSMGAEGCDPDRCRSAGG